MKEIRISFTESNVVFNLDALGDGPGDDAWYIPEETIALLVTPGYVAGECRKVRERFRALENVETIAKVRVLQERGLDIATIAGRLAVSENLLTAFLKDERNFLPAFEAEHSAELATAKRRQANNPELEGRVRQEPTAWKPRVHPLGR